MKYINVKSVVTLVSSIQTLRGNDEVEPEIKEQSYLKDRLKLSTPVVNLPEHYKDASDEIKKIGYVRPKNALELIDSKPKGCCSRMKYITIYIRHNVSSYCDKIINNPWFEGVVLALICLNCIVLATDDPTTLTQKKWQEIADIIFQSLYTVELLIKICGLGFVFNKGAFMRNPWNIIDFLIICFGYLQYLNINNGGFDLRPLRVIRVLRPIGKITSIEGVSTLFSTLINSLNLLLYVAIIYFFFLCLFAIAGFQLWDDSLKNRCRNTLTGEFEDTDTLCGRFECPSGYECAYYGENPNFGLTHFDNFFASLLVVFTTSTGEGWGNIQKAVIEVHGNFVFIFFQLVLFLEFYFLRNFILSILKHNVSQLYEENKKNALLLFISPNAITKRKSRGFRISFLNREISGRSKIKFKV